MEGDTADEVLAEFKERRLGFWGIAQITAGSGLAVYAMWVGILQPGFRRVPLKLQVGYASLNGTDMEFNNGVMQVLHQSKVVNSCSQKPVNYYL